MNLGTVPLFTTNLIQYERPDELNFSPGLVEYLYDARIKVPYEPAYSSRGNNAWHSKDNLHDLDFEWSKKLREMIMQVSGVYYTALTNGQELPAGFVRIKCWALILGQHSYSNYHTHPNSDISGVYWVTKPDLPDYEGRFCVPDVRGGANGSRLEGSQMHYHIPEPGSGLVFSSWMPHFVEPHYQEGDRISVSWNLFIQDPPDDYQGPRSISQSSWRDEDGEHWG